MRKILLCIISLIAILPMHVLARTIHETLIVTHNNQRTLVYLWLKVGTTENGICTNEYIIQPNPSEYLNNGDRLEVDGDLIKRLVGPGKTCASYNFQKEESRVVISDKFLLESDQEGNYISSQPIEGTANIP